MVPSRQASAAGQNGCVPAGSFKRFNSVAKSITTGMQAGGTSMPRARRWSRTCTTKASFCGPAWLRKTASLENRCCAHNDVDEHEHVVSCISNESLCITGT